MPLSETTKPGTPPVTAPGPPTRTGPAIRDTDLLEWFADYMSDAHPSAPQGLDPAADFATYGLDSLDVVILAGAFDERFQVRTDPAFFLRHGNLRSLMAELRSAGIIG